MSVFEGTRGYLAAHSPFFSAAPNYQVMVRILHAPITPCQRATRAYLFKVLTRLSIDRISRTWWEDLIHQPAYRK